MPQYDSLPSLFNDFGRAFIELSQVELSPLPFPDQSEVTTEDEWVEYAQGTDYWRQWEHLIEITTQYTENPDVERTFHFGENRAFTQSVQINFCNGDQRVASISAIYLESGDLHILAEYSDPVTGSGNVLYDDVFPSGKQNLFDITQVIASLEFSALVHETESCAAALDYWMTTHNEWFSQVEWANVRGVNRQTVNDRIREAKQALNE